MNESELINKRLDILDKLIEDNIKNLSKIRDALGTLGKDVKRDSYKNIEGIIGTFDGYHLVDSKGNTFDIPANYAAKSRLVYGDTIKMIDDNGSVVFKQIQKVDRKKLEGVLSKKEGKWVVLTETGSYKISDIAAEHAEVKINDEVVVFVPAANLNAPFATLDRMLNPRRPEIAPRPEVAPRPVAQPRPTTTPAPSIPVPAAVNREAPVVKAPVVEPKPQVRSVMPETPKPRSVSPARPKNPSAPVRKPLSNSPKPIPHVAPKTPEPASSEPVRETKTSIVEDDDLR